jgi:hypothetical protein
MDSRHIKALAETADNLSRSFADIPQIKRGQVWCIVCGHTQSVDGVSALTGAGWPKHCGVTMTIDSPEERAAAGDGGSGGATNEGWG